MYDYRLSIIEGLLPNIENKVPETSQTKKKHEIHVPKKVQKNIKNRYLYKRWKVCYNKNTRKDTIYFCDQCEDIPGLCLDGCFKEYHKEI